ncbi:MAG: arylsulfatase [Haliea sp.]|uniref:arylsulfatase n=1 Tax=Haliea sp. TaxID=1932666 RepID=UPI0032ED6325
MWTALSRSTPWCSASLFCAGMLASLLAAAEPPRPNIVLILADDVALMDFSAYGGEAHTPNIDALAERGVLFANFHATPMCAPSRAMLLTGMDNHLAGVASIPEVLPPEHRGQPGYSMHLEPGVETIATRLQPLGYRTLMTGKWHLGHGPGQLPNHHGFDRSFVLDASGADNWEQRPYLPFYREAPWFEDGEPATLPADFYSSAFIVDKMLEYLEEAPAREQPFLAYLAFQAVHIPVQAPREFSDNYRGVYDAGWQALRSARWQRARDRGLVPADAPLAPMHPELATWEELDADERRLFSRRMEVNAGMIEAMDHHIGRLIAYLQRRGLDENTLFVVSSDNGPEAANPIDSGMMRLWMRLVGYDAATIDTLGERGSYGFIGPAWASAAAGPSDLFKFYSGQGGLRVPLIIAGPGIQPDSLQPAFAVATDIAPTLLDLLQQPVAEAMTGRSLLPLLRGEADRVYPADAATGIETAGNAALFLGDYKLVRNLPPFGDGRWKLYHLATDPGETRDLAPDQPALFAHMQQAYADYAQRVGALDMPPGYQPLQQLQANSLRLLAASYWPFLLSCITVLLLLLAVLWRILARFVKRRG